MGGSAFAAGADPLHTPRMPKNIYKLMKDRCHRVLKELFARVESPIDGPGKKDFGDVDILVTGPKGDAKGKQETFDEIAKVLQATRMIVEKGKGTSAHLAIPWPTKHQLHAYEFMHANTDKDSIASVAPGGPEKFVQVDVQLCETDEKLEWMMFKMAHGDLWNLLGTTMRPYGLTIDDEAFWIRIPEIEKVNRNRAKVFLTSRPSDVLWFLKLPTGYNFREPFMSADDMFEYVSLCRCFWIPPVDPDQEAVSALTEELKGLKASDRKRVIHRPLFKQWVEEWKPQARAEGRFAKPPMSREELTKEALDRFAVKDKYYARLNDFLQEKQRDMITRNIIKGHIPHGDPMISREITYRACLVKALKRIIFEGDHRYGIVPKTSLKDENGFFIMDDVVDFMVRHMEAIGKVAMAQSEEAFSRRRKEKQARDATKKATEASADANAADTADASDTAETADAADIVDTAYTVRTSKK